MLDRFIQIIDSLQFTLQRGHDHFEYIQQLLFSVCQKRNEKKQIMNYRAAGWIFVTFLNVRVIENY